MPGVLIGALVLLALFAACFAFLLLAERLD